MNKIFAAAVLAALPVSGAMAQDNAQPQPTIDVETCMIIESGSLNGVFCPDPNAPPLMTLSPDNNLRVISTAGILFGLRGEFIASCEMIDKIDQYNAEISLDCDDIPVSIPERPEPVVLPPLGPQIGA